MRNSLFLVLLFFVITCAGADAQTFYGTEDLKVFREGREKEMRDPKETALPEDEVAGFAGLKYFDTDSRYRLKANLIHQPSQQKMNFETSSGRVKTYLRYGYLEFKLAGKKHRLAVFQYEPLAEPQPDDDLLFVPFRDETSGKDTYGGGRYMNIWKPKKKGAGKVLLDFNMAYNPSCAYGTLRFSCPIPPKENRLSVEIKAGEKVYKTGH